jgi:hypothetical protein
MPTARARAGPWRSPRYTVTTTRQNANPTERMQQSSRDKLRKYGAVSHPDELSPFRYFRRTGKWRRRTNGVLVGYEISLEYLKQVWDEQQGTCPYSGVKLVLPSKMSSTHNRYPWPDDVPSYMRPSIDRIDSSKGYVEGNIQFVSQVANAAKNTRPHNEMVEFCLAVANHWSERNR